MKRWLLGLGAIFIIALFIPLLTNEVSSPLAPSSAAPLTSPTIEVLASEDPEAKLAKILSDIERKELDAALLETERLLQQYPNFRLAHLIRGDLLLARRKPLSTFGDAENAPQERLNDLRDEIRVRLQASRDRQVLSEQIPRYLLEMPADQKYAVIVDTGKSRLYLYQNDPDHPRLVADYYISHGKLGAAKMIEGDKKTPIGVYHVTASLPAEKLADLYGNGAFPINYPNEWDKRQGRKGHGIWLHGTPSDTFARPPKASDGCVVLSNVDLTAISKNIQVGLTPVIISHSVEWLSVADWKEERATLKKEIETWRTDWESRDTERYLTHYSKDFKVKNIDFDAFSDQKRKVGAGKEWIKVKLSNLSLFRDPGQEGLMVVTFDQDYQSNNLSNQMKKRQYWIRENNQWKIIYEGAV